MTMYFAVLATIYVVSIIVVNYRILRANQEAKDFNKLIDENNQLRKLIFDLHEKELNAGFNLTEK